MFLSKCSHGIYMPSKWPWGMVAWFECWKYSRENTSDMNVWCFHLAVITSGYDHLAVWLCDDTARQPEVSNVLEPPTNTKEIQKISLRVEAFHDGSNLHECVHKTSFERCPTYSKQEWLKKQKKTKKGISQNGSNFFWKWDFHHLETFITRNMQCSLLKLLQMVIFSIRPFSWVVR